MGLPGLVTFFAQENDVEDLQSLKKTMKEKL